MAGLVVGFRGITVSMSRQRWRVRRQPLSVVRNWRGWAVLALVVFAILWWLLPPLLYRHTDASADARLKAITDTRTALLAGLVGAGALLTFWLNSRTHRLTEQGQITDRF